MIAFLRETKKNKKLLLMVQQNMWYLNKWVACTYKNITLNKIYSITAVSYTATLNRRALAYKNLIGESDHSYSGICRVLTLPLDGSTDHESIYQSIYFGCIRNSHTSQLYGRQKKQYVKKVTMSE